MSVTEAKIEQFKEITGEDNTSISRGLLEACDGNVAMAVEMHFTRADGGSIESMQVDEEDDIEVLDLPATRSTAASSSAAARAAIAIDDDDDGVRQPLAPVRGRLVDQSYSQYYGDGTSSRRRANPVFEQYRDVLGSDAGRSGGGSGLANYRGDAATSSRNFGGTTHSKRLQTIFRPPIEIISRLSWDALLDAGRTQNRWILVNIQDPSEFACQVLNRDVWSTAALKEVIKAHFIFWQVMVDSHEGRRITNYYQLNAYPAVFIIDPRNGELVLDLKSRDPNDLLAEVSDFCSQYPTFEARDEDFHARAAPIKTTPARSEQPSTSGLNNKNKRNKPAEIVDSKRAENVDSPEYQAKRLKKNLTISDGDVSVIGEDELAPSPSKADVELDDWHTYVTRSTADSETIKLMLRLTSGERLPLELNEKCPLKAVFAFLQDHGISANECLLVLTYPKREYSLDHASLTLSDLNFASQEVVHVDRIL